jgi:hypothetical protein
MEALLYGLPFHIILRGVVQDIRGSPPGRSATLGKEGFKAQLEFCLFSQVECVYLGEEQRGRASISDTSTGRLDTKLALPFRARARA